VSTIWKFAITPTRELTLDMPEGAIPICIQTQGCEPFMWAEVDPKRTLVRRKFLVVGTGWDLDPSHGVYVGTFQIFDEETPLVFHVYDGGT
jgi:hypothetical protein